MEKRKVIIVTDGDPCAVKTIEGAAKNLGLRCISKSGGAPTQLSGNEIVEYVKQAPQDPVIVMVDDRGCRDKGKGEQALEEIVRHPDVDVIGIIAVASHTSHVSGVKVDVSVCDDGRIIEGAVDKEGLPEKEGHVRVEGDTVDILNKLDVPLIVGIGDIGKQNGRDDRLDGSKITTTALKYVLDHSLIKH